MMSFKKHIPLFLHFFLIIFIFYPEQGHVQAQIELPAPHQLVAPKNGEKVSKQELVFFWTSAVKLPDRQVVYVFTITPVNSGQLPEEAVVKNTPLLQQKMKRTFFSYPVKENPLEQGITYAWRVRAVDEMDRAISQNDGYSQIFTLLWEPESPELAQYNPVITTDPIVMTGMRSGPLLITTDRIMMVGMRQGVLPIVTEPIKMTGMRYQPVSIHTDAIKMTGMRYRPLHITTDRIMMTGLRVDTERLVEWWGQQIDGLKANLGLFIQEAQAYQEAAAVEKLNEVVTMVDGLKKQAAAAQQVEMEKKMEEVQSLVQGLQTTYTKTAVQGTAVESETKTVDQQQAVGNVVQETQAIIGKLDETKIQVPAMIDLDAGKSIK